MHYDELKHMLCEELEQVMEKGEITNSSLEQIDKLTHSIKSLATIMAMEDAGYSGMSYDDGYNGSYARGRSRMTGRYISRDGYANRGYSSRYSRDGDKREQFAMQLEELMEKAPDEKTRNQLRKTISDVNNNMEV